MAAYKTEIDVANRALQHLRVRRIKAFTDQSMAALECAFAYPRLRETELKEHLWRFSTRDTMLYAVSASSYLWTPPSYSAGTSYALGAVVVDSAGDWWQTKVSGLAAGTAPAQGDNWRHYYGPDMLSPFVAQATNSISAPAAPTVGQTAGGSFGPRTLVFKVTYVGAAGESLPSGSSSDSISASNLATVTSPASQTGATQYNVYAGETATAVVLQNANPINIGTNWTEPGTGVARTGAMPPLSTATSFYAGDLTSLNGTPYLSLISSNTDTPPSVNWVNVGGTIAPLTIMYPLGAGPLNDVKTNNVYRLPHGYLRKAPTKPHAQSTVFLGAIHGGFREDWVLEGNYLVSSDPGPVMLRYVADSVDVPEFDASFCEMLSARIAEEIGPLLITDPALLAPLLANARRHYEAERRDATAVNAIEIGPIDLETDDYIRCRY